MKISLLAVISFFTETSVIGLIFTLAGAATSTPEAFAKGFLLALVTNFVALGVLFYKTPRQLLRAAK